MPGSKLEIVNLALAHLGQVELADFADDSAQGKEAARLARLSYDAHRDAVLVELPWNFATTRALLNPQATAPAWGWANAYPQPAGCLRVIEVDGDRDQTWEVEEVDGVTCIVTDLGPPIQIRYIRRVEDASRYSAGFVQALAARLALEWAESLTRDQQVTRNLAELYNAKLRLARSVDSAERTPQVIDATTWTDARQGGARQLAQLDGDPQPNGFP